MLSSPPARCSSGDGHTSHLILCRPLLLLPPIPPSIRVSSNESTLRMRWPEYWPCSHSRAMPSFPSQLEWKIGLAWANTRGILNSPSTWILVRHRHFFKKKREYSSCDCNENRFNSVILNTYNVKKYSQKKEC